MKNDNTKCPKVYPTIPFPPPPPPKHDDRPAKAIKLLREYEWCGRWHGDPVCPCCGASKYTDKKHEPDCEWYALIRK